MFKLFGKQQTGRGARLSERRRTAQRSDMPHLIIVIGQDEISSDMALSISRLLERSREARVHDILAVPGERPTLDYLRSVMERDLSNKSTRYVQDLSAALLVNAEPVPAGREGGSSKLKVQVECIDLAMNQTLWIQDYDVGEGDVLKTTDWGKRAAYLIHNAFNAKSNRLAI